MESVAQTLQSTLYSFGRSAEAEAEVLWLLEEVSWDYAGFVSLPQHSYKIVCTPCLQARGNNGAEAAGWTIELVMFGEEFVDQRSVGFE